LKNPDKYLIMQNNLEKSNNLESVPDEKMPTIEVLMVGTGFDVKGGVTSVQRLIIDAQVPNISIKHVPTIVKGSAWQNIIAFLGAIIQLCWTIFTKEIDIIHIHFSERGSTLRKSILIFISLLFRQSIILHAHGASYREFYAALPKFVQGILALLLGKCSRIIVLSESWQDYYHDTFAIDKSRLIVLYNPVIIPIEIPNRLNRKQLKFIFLGLIGKRGGALDLVQSAISFPRQNKGAFDLINAVAALPAEDLERVELVLAGNGDLDAANQLISDLKLTDKVTILTWLDFQQRDKLLAEADGFILPSYNEGLPMSMLESMAWGLPVIVTPVGGIPEVIVDKYNGLLVEPGNREQLVAAMQSLIRDEDLRISLGMAARHSVIGLDIHSYMKSLVEVYTSVIEERKTR
jgi:glycosyltransferase involved in cell wall biosynthesis